MSTTMDGKPADDNTPALSMRQPLSPPPRVDSQQLFEGQRELIIQHQGEEYRLRITRHDKLILTK
ncbi:hemin uptake protein HemP [Aquabacterium sp.]|uniref:hemin uptake protein HemP n=1 Tax=Aquabacterium sp. TaxID=1872578 RepID=UPI004038205E